MGAVVSKSLRVQDGLRAVVKMWNATSAVEGCSTIEGQKDFSMKTPLASLIVNQFSLTSGRIVP